MIDIPKRHYGPNHRMAQAQNRIVFARTPSGDVLAYEIPPDIKSTPPTDAILRLAWCRQHGKHVATRNDGVRWWWMLNGSKWVIDDTTWWSDRLREAGEPPGFDKP